MYAGVVHGIATRPKPKPKPAAAPASGPPQPHPPNPADAFAKAVGAISSALDRQGTVCGLRSSVDLANRSSADLATAVPPPLDVARTPLEQLPRTPLERPCILFVSLGCQRADVWRRPLWGARGVARWWSADVPRGGHRVEPDVGDEPQFGPLGAGGCG